MSRVLSSTFWHKCFILHHRRRGVVRVDCNCATLWPLALSDLYSGTAVDRRVHAVVKVRGGAEGAQLPCSHLSPPPAIVWAVLRLNNAKLVGFEWVWGLLQNLASSGDPPPASQNHFNHWVHVGILLNLTLRRQLTRRSSTAGHWLSEGPSDSQWPAVRPAAGVFIVRRSGTLGSRRATWPNGDKRSDWLN